MERKKIYKYVVAEICLQIISDEDLLTGVDALDGRVLEEKSLKKIQYTLDSMLDVRKKTDSVDKRSGLDEESRAKWDFDAKVVKHYHHTKLEPTGTIVFKFSQEWIIRHLIFHKRIMCRYFFCWFPVT